VKLNTVPRTRAVFCADNNGFDWMFVCWYLWYFTDGNPFGFSSVNINCLFKGLSLNMRASCKKFRKTVHDHNPVNDAKWNAEIMLELMNRGLVL